MSMSLTRQIVACCFLAGAAWLVNSSRVLAEGPDFERDIAPLLVNHCLECHQPTKPSGKLLLATRDALVKGGESGPALALTQPETSLMLDRITSGEMPPVEKETKPLTPVEVGTLREWILAGANWPAGRELGVHEKQVDLAAAREFWSFRPVQRPALPAVGSKDRVANPIDAFIAQKLAAQGLSLAPRATPEVLLRRVSLDLRGLPPSLDEQAEFASDKSPEKYERLLDRMLSDLAYGEHWGRHWLDLVRYADSNGYERDSPKPSVWQYRDYVINSLNQDKPYDRFVLEQLAGDELLDATSESVIALGFHALGTWQDEVDPLEAAQYRADELDDMLRTTSQTFLGLTLGCARCHNHKFDPLTMVDYYSLAAILAPLQRPSEGRTDRDRPAGNAQQLTAQALRDAAIQKLEQEATALVESQMNGWLTGGQSQLPAAAIAALLLPADKRTAEQKKLADEQKAACVAEVRAHLSAELAKKLSRLVQEQNRLRAETPDLPRSYFLYEDSPTAPPIYLLLSGRASNPGPLMQPRVPAVLANSQPLFPAAEGGSTKRRLTLARWVANEQNPLTARVIVNRVWQHHFGKGLVATPSDLGQIGARPTHPELLDWLADWFTHEGGWSLKKLHRFILASETYQQSSAWNGAGGEKDPENKLLWRYPYHRLDVEAVRDSMLATAGNLNRQMHGPAVFLPIPAAAIEAHTDKQAAWQAETEPAINRRTIYAYVKRTLVVPLLETLDFCDTTQSTDLRTTTSVAPQALTLFNGQFVNQQAAEFARRLEREAGEDLTQQLNLAYRLALARPLTAQELATLRQFCEQESARLQTAEEGKPLAAAAARHASLVQACRAILNLNEFVYPN